MDRNINFPTTVVDGFFERPDEIREFALAQEFYLSNNNAFPGKRTEGLHLINPIIFNSTIKKIFNLFYDTQTKCEFIVEASFQIIGGQYQSGWIHRDDPTIITAIVYLTPNNQQGTSLFRKKNYFMDDYNLVEKKVEAYKKQTSCHESMTLNNEQYEETLNVKGLYNRLFLFDSIMYHGAHDYFGEEKKDSRLTLVMFFNRISAEGNLFPIPRMNVNSFPTIL